MRLTIDEYCKHFKISREMLSSKLKAKKLNYIIENNKTYIIVNDANLPNNQSTASTVTVPNTTSRSQENQIAKPKTTVATVLALYQRENQQLKEKIIQLENKIDKLIDDKEQMLRDEMQKIEQVYSAKDEQLKTILELVNTKLMIDHSSKEIETIETTTTDVDSKQKIEDKTPKLVELKSYIKTLDLKSYQRKIIRKRFLAVRNSDVRIIQQNGQIYLDFSKYDYSDLLEY